MSTNGDLKKQYDGLIAAIKTLNAAYYQGDPLVPDYEYDALVRQAGELRERLGITGELPFGTNVPQDSRKAKHRSPMLSLDNVYTHEAAHTYLTSIASTHDDAWVGELKYDGLAVSLTYCGGWLMTAATRGNRFEGEDVTATAVQARGVLPCISGPLEDASIRGEIYVTHDDLKLINTQRALDGQEPFLTPRGAAVGLLRTTTITPLQKKLKFVAYDADDIHRFNTYVEFIVYLKENGFYTPAHVVGNAQAMTAYWDTCTKTRSTLPFDCDGVVYKLNHIRDRLALGATSRAPRWAVAHKFEAEAAVTSIVRIIHQVGRTGVITPVGELDPVTIQGVTISRVTLHNEGWIIENGIAPGCLIQLARAGDTIPHVEKVLKTSDIPYAPCTVCPACGSAAVRIDGSPFRRCTGSLTCKAQLLIGLVHFCSRDAFDIKGMAGQRLVALLADGSIQRAADIFRLAQSDKPASIPASVLQAIETARTIPLHRYITALGLPRIGQRAAHILALHVNDIDGFHGLLDGIVGGDSVVTSELMRIPGFGQETIRLLASAAESARRTSQDLIDAGVVVLPTITTKQQEEYKALSGHTLVFTGTLTNMPRSKAKALSEAAGARVLNHVSKETTAAVIGYDPGQTAERAKELGIPIWDETTWIKKLTGQ